jgi:hypothetical protein
MYDLEREVWWEARAMTRREVITKAITKQLSWVRAAEILGISARHMRRLRCKVERWGMSRRQGALCRLFMPRLRPTCAATST